MAVKSIIVKTNETPTNCLRCPVCNERFWLKCKYDDHMATHKELRLSCNICSKGFYDQKLLDEHYLTHTEVIKTYDCRECHRKFLQKYQLEQHMQFHKPVDVNNYAVSKNKPCDISKCAVNTKKPDVSKECTVNLKKPDLSKKYAVNTKKLDDSKKCSVYKRKSVHFSKVLQMKNFDDDTSESEEYIEDDDDDDEEEFSDFEDYIPANKIVKTRSGRLVKRKKKFDDEETEVKRKSPKTELTHKNPAITKHNDKNEHLQPSDMNSLHKNFIRKKLSVVVEKISDSVYKRYAKPRDICTENQMDSDGIISKNSVSDKTSEIAVSSKLPTKDISSLGKKSDSLTTTVSTNSVIDEKTENILPSNISNKNISSHAEKSGSTTLGVSSNSVTTKLPNKNSSNVPKKPTDVPINPTTNKKYSITVLRKPSNKNIIVNTIVTSPSSKVIQSNNISSKSSKVVQNNNNVASESSKVVQNNSNIASESSKMVQNNNIASNISKVVQNNNIAIESPKVVQNNNIAVESSKVVQNNKIPSESNSVPVGRVKPVCKKAKDVDKTKPSGSVASNTFPSVSSSYYSQVGKQFLYVGPSSDINKIKQVIHEVNTLSHRETPVSNTISNKKVEPTVPNKSALNSPNSNLAGQISNSGPSTSFSSIPVQCYTLGSNDIPSVSPLNSLTSNNLQNVNQLKESLPNEEGILEKKIVQDFIVIKVTPEYMQKLQKDSFEHSKAQSVSNLQPTNKKVTEAVPKSHVDSNLNKTITSPTKKQNVVNRTSNVIPNTSSEVCKNNNVIASKNRSVEPQVVHSKKDANPRISSQSSINKLQAKNVKENESNSSTAESKKELINQLNESNESLIEKDLTVQKKNVDKNGQISLQNDSHIAVVNTLLKVVKSVENKQLSTQPKLNESSAEINTSLEVSETDDLKTCQSKSSEKTLHSQNVKGKNIQVSSSSSSSSTQNVLLALKRDTLTETLKSCDNECTNSLLETALASHNQNKQISILSSHKLPSTSVNNKVNEQEKAKDPEKNEKKQPYAMKTYEKIHQNRCSKNIESKTTPQKNDKAESSNKNLYEKLQQRYKAKLEEKERKKKEKYEFKKKMKYLEKLLNSKSKDSYNKNIGEGIMLSSGISINDIIRISEKNTTETKEKTDKINCTLTSHSQTLKQANTLSVELPSTKDSNHKDMYSDVTIAPKNDFTMGCPCNSKDCVDSSFCGISNDSQEKKNPEKFSNIEEAIERARSVCSTFTKLNLNENDYLKSLDELDKLITLYNIEDKCDSLTDCLKFCLFRVDSYRVRQKAISLSTKIKNVNTS